MDRFDDGKYFIINPDTRKVTVPVKYSSVIGDNGSQIFTFSIKRYIDGYDIMDCNDVTIHYDIISEENGSKLYSDVYQCDDLRVSETDENIVLVSWKLSKNATKFNGILSFTIKYSTTYVDEEEQVKETYVLQSRICEKLRIFTRVNNSQQIVEEYGDVLQQWKEDLERSKPTANVSKEGKEVTITITDKNGTTSSVVFDGASAYEIAVENGFEGSEEEWLESLKYTSSEEFQQLAEQVKQDAQTSSNKAQEATTAAINADKYAKDAQASKEEANESALSAAEASNSAGISASSAADSASTAKTNADKTNQDKTEVSNLVSGFDDHVAEKTTEFNQNASEKTNAFDIKVVEANSTIDEKVAEATSQAEKAKEEADRATQVTDGKLDKNQGAENSDKILTVDSDGNVITKSKEDLGIIAKNDNFLYKDVAKSLNPNVTDSFQRAMWNLKLYGQSTQGADPNPTNPQEITAISQFDGAPTGGNLFSMDFFKLTSSSDKNVLDTLEKTDTGYKAYRKGGNTTNQAVLLINDNSLVLEKGKTYFLTIKNPKAKMATGEIVSLNDGQAKMLIEGWGMRNNFKYTPNNNSKAINVNFQYNFQSIEYITFDYIQCEINETATPYTPYVSQPFSYTPTNPMYSTQDGSIADYVDVEKGVEVYNMQNTSIVFNNNGRVDLVQENTIRYFFNRADVAELNNAIINTIVLNAFKCIDDDSDTIHYKIGGANGSYIFIYIPKNQDGNNDVAYAESYLNNLGVIFNFAVATPTETPIDPEQLQMLKALYTYNGATNFLCNGEVSFAYEVSQQINNQKIWEAINANKLNIATK